MTAPTESAAVERVWKGVLADPRSALEHGLSPTDLQTLLMALSRRRASAVTPARLMSRWREDRFVQVAASDPRVVWRIEARLWDLLPEMFTGVDLSPVTPLGTCSAVATVDQHRVISTIRGSEVISDPTNVLALEAAVRRKQSPAASVDLAACHRVIRAQPFHGAGLFQHFRMFVLVSSSRDRGSGAAEAAMLTSHVRFWAGALAELLPARDVHIEVTAFDSPVLVERLHDTVLPALEPLPGRVSVVQDLQRERARRYYTSGAVRIAVDDGTSTIHEIGDGGFTDWTAQLMADGKERCFVSCVATERLAALAAPSPSTDTTATTDGRGSVGAGRPGVGDDLDCPFPMHRSESPTPPPSIG